MYFVYFLTNRFRSVLYIGVTNNVRRRVEEHRSEIVPGFTTAYHCKYLLYIETFDRMYDALTREKQLKKWSRLKKESLVKTTNPEMEDITMKVLL